MNLAIYSSTNQYLRNVAGFKLSFQSVAANEIASVANERIMAVVRSVSCMVNAASQDLLTPLLFQISHVPFSRAHPAPSVSKHPNQLVN